MADVTAEFESWRQRIVGRTISLAWRGYGSTIFLEFGELTPTHKSNGEAGHERGEVTIMLEWGWRLEGETTIVCGDGSEDAEIAAGLRQLIGLELKEAALAGRLPELALTFSSDLYVTSFWPCAGDPGWGILDNTMDGPNALQVKHGKLVLAN
ncbi:hypothetical protein [Paradevosia shaoguanensis]|uniref:Uncharacterized protein n=1 Tax=Paradevosia shaoguanensis TaxID=1335043 RepID=A0AA41UBH9_9HYPH|nr:hypothetical protein [Paradevosia shaoguanensis]MCF1742907.1 hypothetical protein [Paradevosia shaoguanensis]MCI0127390.1 hypothetical protein [Paradevosia shaoguanensis]